MAKKQPDLSARQVILGLIDKVRSPEIQRDELQAMQPRDQAAYDELRAKCDEPRLLLTPASELTEAERSTLRDITDMKVRLEAYTGAFGRLENEIQRRKETLRNTCLELLATRQKDAYKQRRDLIAKADAFALEVCGGDVARAKPIAKFIQQNQGTDAVRWADHLGCCESRLHQNHDVIGAARMTLGSIELFDGHGKTSELQALAKAGYAVADLTPEPA